MFKRIIWIILDSVGAGELPDSELFGDKGADTLGHIFEKIQGFDLPNLRKLGLGNIDEIKNIPKVCEPIGVYGKARERSNGKDTTVGHWEMTGIYTENRFPTYPDGFPDELIEEFIKFSNIPGILCNSAGSGTEVIQQYGEEHIKSKKPIVYTSADSVFQIACHEKIYPIEELYRICRVARKILDGENKVARVIARPFVGTAGNFIRTSNRKDFSIMPEDGNLLDILTSNNIKVYGIGKIGDIFCGKGISESVHTDNNMDGVDKTLEKMKTVDHGLIFANLVEFDSVWGHRRNVKGYAGGLKDFDNRLPEIMNHLREDDLLIINSDHGCDPTYNGTDHTREYIPVLMYGERAAKNVNLHIMDTFADLGQTIADNFGLKIKMGTSKMEEICQSNII
ncbi:MAG: phosphopentomutase [Eubacterium sp.]